MEDDLEYYERRAAEERRAADHASSPEAKLSHRTIADRYALIVEQHRAEPVGALDR